MLIRLWNCQGVSHVSVGSVECWQRRGLMPVSTRILLVSLSQGGTVGSGLCYICERPSKGPRGGGKRRSHSGGGMTRVAAVGELPRLICPHCQSSNVTAVGEYICRDCGTVIGPVPMPPMLRQTPVPAKHRPTSLRHVPAPLRYAAARYRKYVMALEGEYKKSVKRRYLNIVKEHLDKVAEALGDEIATVALEVFKRLGKRVYQGSRRGLWRPHWRI